MTGAADRSGLRSVLKLAAYPFALGLAVAVLCYLAAGVSLGFFLGPIAAAALVVPPMVSGSRDRFAAVVAAGAFTDSIGFAWLIAISTPDVTFMQWLACYVILVAFAFALAGTAWLLRRGVGSIASGAITTIAALAWLAWPIWTSPWITAPIASWMTPAHPPLAINHVLLDLGVWTQQPWMYRHTVLGQDVAYVLPQSIWPCVIVHALMAAGLAWPARSSRRGPRPPELSPAAEAS